jgi:hypothetical protein
VTFEEGTWAAWLYDLLKPHVTGLAVCDPRKNALLKEGNKSDKIDARKLADLQRGGYLRLNGTVMNPNLKPQGGRSFAASLLHGFAIRSATGQNRPTDRQAAQKRNGATKSEGLDVGKYFWRSGAERCFSLDIPLYRTSGPRHPHFRTAALTAHEPSPGNA